MSTQKKNSKISNLFIVKHAYITPIFHGGDNNGSS